MAYENSLSVEELRAEVDRLSKLASWPGCPGGGWQFPFDFGSGVLAPTYTPIQKELHPWRRKVVLDALDMHYSDSYPELSVLDLGAGEGAIAAGLWERGVRDITCVEVRDVNIQKAKLVRRVFGCDFNLVQQDVQSFLEKDDRIYDVVIFMGLLYHLQNPFGVSQLIAKKTKKSVVVETVIAQPKIDGFYNTPEYSPEPAGFFVRIDNQDSQTAGLSNIELWPTRDALNLLLHDAGFESLEDLCSAEEYSHWFESGQRCMLLAHKS